MSATNLSVEQLDEMAMSLRSEGLTYMEISRRLDENVHTVWSRCNRELSRKQSRKLRAKTVAAHSGPAAASTCSCESPVTYTEEDDELRCLTCGRGVR